MIEYKVEVKSWMLKKSSNGYNFMKDRNNDIPMPLMVMYGTKIGEAPGMTKMTLHGDLKTRITQRCMHCGIVITNPVSQYFGMGPKCGGHNYVNPFKSEEALNEAIASYREKLVNITWTGWIANSAILSIEDNNGTPQTIQDMLYEVTEDSEYLYNVTPEVAVDKNDETKTVAMSKPVLSHVINARVGKPVRGTDDYSVFLSFSYNKTAVAAVKDLKTRFWNPDTTEWEIEYRDLEALKVALPEYTFNVTNEEIIPAAVETSVTDFDFKTKPMAHQLTGIQYGLDHNRWLLADDMGLGKTKQLIDLAVIRKNTIGLKHCLIICGVNSLKWNWLEEVEKHSNETGWILGMKQSKRTGKWTIGSNADKLTDIDKIGNDPEIDSHYFIITNIESLRNSDIANKLKELCDNGVIGMVACDESHRCKNLKTLQGEGLLQLQPTYRVAMTGTPLVNNPLDLYAILKWLGYEKYSFWSFKNYFCNTDEWGKVVSYKNIDKLKDQLGNIMLRRTKDEVLDLPEKIYINEYVELTDEQRKLYNQIIDEAVNSDDDDKDCILATYLRLRQVSGGIGDYGNLKKNPKLDRLEELVEEAVYSGTKVIVYSNWIGGLKPAIERLTDYNPVVLTGETNDSDRQMIVNKFQTDPDVKVILATTDAAGVGLTLTAATEVIFVDEPWTDAAKEQACDRAHRIGTKSAVTIHTIMGHGTYDEDVHDIVLGKKSMFDNIVNKKDLAKLKLV